MSIPVPQSLVTSAATYNAPSTAIQMNLCKPPPEGLRAVPMQFLFSANNNWLVDLSLGSPAPPLSQCCSLYIDAINSTQNVTILFPDSGFEVQCAAGHGLLCPVLTGMVLPRFYVFVPATNATDIVNIFAINQFIPEFSCP